MYIERDDRDKERGLDRDRDDKGKDGKWDDTWYWYYRVRTLGALQRGISNSIDIEALSPRRESQATVPLRHNVLKQLNEVGHM